MKKYFLVCLIAVCSLIFLSGCQKSKKKDEVKVLSSKGTIKELITDVTKDQEDPNNGDFPTLDYASDQRIMFHNQNAFFVFDVKKKKIVSAIDLKDMGLFSQKGDYESKILAAADGSVVRLYQTEGEKTRKDYYFYVDDQKISQKKTAFDDIYEGDFYKAYKDRSFLGKSTKEIQSVLGKSGQNDSNVLIQNEKTLVYLSYPSDVFIQPEEEFQNLQLSFYDVSKNTWKNMPVFQGYVKLNTKQDTEKLDTGDGKVWMKRSRDGVLYFDVDALRSTKACRGKFGTLVVGNVFRSQTGKLVVTFENAKDFDVTLKPVLSLNTIDDEGEPQIQEIKKNQNTYTFTGLKKGKYYYIDYYPTADPESEKQLKNIDDHNLKQKVTVDNQ